MARDDSIYSHIHFKSRHVMFVWKVREYCAGHIWVYGPVDKLVQQSQARTEL
jgi:hypothetical protein